MSSAAAHRSVISMRAAFPPCSDAPTVHASVKRRVCRAAEFHVQEVDGQSPALGPGQANQFASARFTHKHQFTLLPMEDGARSAPHDARSLYDDEKSRGHLDSVTPGDLTDDIGLVISQSYP